MAPPLAGAPLAETPWQQVDTPALLVDVGRLEANIADMAATFADRGVALRPHFKTTKCLAVAERQRAAGAIGFTCSTPGEVQALGLAGFGGLLWAHLPVGPAKVAAAVSFAGEWGVTVFVDSMAVAAPLSDAAVAHGVVVPCLLEVDTGQHRAGVDPDRAAALARALAALPGLSVRGVATHEGHLSAAPDRKTLEAAGFSAASTLVAVAQELSAAGTPCEVVSVGSTPGVTSAPWIPGVTEGRPGTYAYYDANQVRLGSTTFDRCALSVLTRVVSVNRSGQAIIDAGLKAMSADALTAENGGGIVLDPGGRIVPDLKFVTANEEHGFLAGATDRLAVGDLLRVLPNHACGTTNMWSRLLAVAPDGATERWDIVGRH